MHLVACASPQEPLEVAPRSALLADLTEGEQWEGFWSSDSYFVRCTKTDGDVAWFKLADEVADGASADARKRGEVRVLPFRKRGVVAASSGRVAVLVTTGPDGRRMLVGTAHRSPRSGGRRTGE
jgi:hypothetical protein